MPFSELHKILLTGYLFGSSPVGGCYLSIIDTIPINVSGIQIILFWGFLGQRHPDTTAIGSRKDQPNKKTIPMTLLHG
jgi:hypothetical protein